MIQYKALCNNSPYLYPWTTHSCTIPSCLLFLHLTKPCVHNWSSSQDHWIVLSYIDFPKWDMDMA